MKDVPRVLVLSQYEAFDVDHDSRKVMLSVARPFRRSQRLLASAGNKAVHTPIVTHRNSFEGYVYRYAGLLFYSTRVVKFVVGRAQLSSDFQE